MNTSKTLVPNAPKPTTPSSNLARLYRRHCIKPKNKIDPMKEKSHNKSLNLSTNPELLNLKLNYFQKLQLHKPKIRYRSRSHTEKDEMTNNLLHLKSHLPSSKVQSQRTNMKKLIQSLKCMRSSSDLFKPRSRQPSIGKKQSSHQFLPNMAFAYRTKQGVLKSNPHKPNQDSLLIKSKVTDQNNYLFAVADGHGMHGHDVSQYAVKNLPILMDLSLKTLNPPEAFKAAYAKLQEGVTESEVNSQYSGTTLISILLRKNELFCANVGDSRAILGTQDKRKTWEIAELSRDHKPELPSQKERILKLGGRIEPFRDENGNQLGPQRVWVGKQKMQGLAMSRSIGDNVSKPVGVTFQPQIIYRKITQSDKYIIMGSDGLWQFVSNQEACKLLIPYYLQNNVEQGAQELLSVASERWEQDDNSVVDDITVIVIFLQ